MKSSCYHCGEDCGQHPILLDEKPFCCEGCKMVYQILSENDLCTYYDLESHPGISLKSREQGTRFEYLDSPEIVDRLIEYQDESQTRITFYLPQVHCSSCIWLLEKLYKLRPGILHSQVNFLKKELYLSFDPETISLREVVELLTTLGYEPEINLQDLNRKKDSKYNRRLFYQLGVAGFAFGNIMLFSFPEYLALESYLEPEFAQLFGYLNLLLALPVLLYSAQDYLRSAWFSLRQGGLNIDVPISLGILTLFSRSAYDILTHTGAGYLDSLVGLVFFLLIGKWFQNRTYATLSFEREYESYFPVAVIRKRGEVEESVALPELKVGDRILIRNQELIPADSVLISGSGHIDYSFVTGEAEPQSRQEGQLIYAGGRQVGAAIELEIVKEVSQSYLTRLWNMEAFQEEENRHSLFHLADRIGKYFTLAIILIAIVAGAYWLIVQPELAVHVFTSVLIVACPCALALTSPFTFGNALRLMGKWGFYLKNPQVVERMAHLNHIVFDKTGTLTQGQEVQTEIIGAPLTEAEQSMLRSLARQSSHPMSRAIAEVYGDAHLAEVQELKEIPGKGLCARLGKQALCLGSAALLADQGIALPEDRKGSWLAIDGQLRAHFLLKNHYRQGLRPIVQQLAKSQELSLLSGDHAGEAERLQQVFTQQTPMHFEQSPFDKLSYIQDLQQQGEKVMMIGDGLNDAGALKQSDVGIALAEDINNFSPACDAILDGKSFGRLPQLLRFSQGSLKLVKTGFVLSLLYNIVGLGFAVQGLLAPVVAAILMPLSSITIIAFAVGSTYLLGRKVGREGGRF